MHSHSPLAYALRPQVLTDFIGQSHLLGPGKPLAGAIDKGYHHSMLFWGPPGTGKTTLAHLIAAAWQLEFVALSAVSDGVKAVREVVKQAKETAKPILLFLDEIHRFTKSQQDALLLDVETGHLVLIGATTENPGFYVNRALLSRVTVYPFYAFTDDEMQALIASVFAYYSDQGSQLSFESEPVQGQLMAYAAGDARRLHNSLEMIARFLSGQAKPIISKAVLEQVLGEQIQHFDNKGDHFYEQISALHKSVRGSDPDAALYWFAVMLAGGCDPRYLGRRLVRMASEDIGNADPRALTLCESAVDVYSRLGSPEGDLALAQAVVYLAVAPKSNAVYTAFACAQAAAKKYGQLPVPNHLCNASTGFAREINKGDGYRYDHNEPAGLSVGQRYFPDKMPDQAFYEPTDRGLEKQIRDKLIQIRHLQKQAKESASC